MKRFYFSRVMGNGDSNTQTPPSPNPDDEKKFSQSDFNKAMAEHKKGLQTQLQTTQAELEKMKKEGGNVEGLQAKIKELSDSLLSKDELAKQEAERLKQAHQDELGQFKTRADSFQQLHHGLLLSNEISKAAMKHKAWDAEQLEVFVGSKAKVTPELDNSGKPTGKFKAMIPWVVDGKNVELTVDEAVAKMREDKRFGNLFRADGTPGAGMTLNNAPTQPSSNGQLPMDTASYMAQRKANKQAGVI